MGNADELAQRGALEEGLADVSGVGEEGGGQRADDVNRMVVILT